MKNIFEQSPEVGDIDREASLDYQLEIIADSFGEFKDRGMLDKEEMRKFNTQMDMIKAIEDKTEREKEKAVLLKRYREIIKSREKKP